MGCCGEGNELTSTNIDFHVVGQLGGHQVAGVVWLCGEWLYRWNKKPATDTSDGNNCTTEHSTDKNANVFIMY